MSRCTVLLAAVSFLLALAPVSATVAADVLPDGTLTAPLVAGETSYAGGAFTAIDYVYDDHGKNVNPARRGGGEMYPDGSPLGSYLGNTADLVSTSLRAEMGSLRVSAVLNSMASGAPALVGIGLDTDRTATTGASALPAGSSAAAAPSDWSSSCSCPRKGGRGR